MSELRTIDRNWVEGKIPNYVYVLPYLGHNCFHSRLFVFTPDFIDVQFIHIVHRIDITISCDDGTISSIG